MGKIRWGKKVTRSHSTATDTAADVIQLAHDLEEVTKISISIIKPVHGVKRKLSFKLITGGILAKIQGSGGVQEVYIYTNDPAATQEVLTRDFDRSH